MLLLGMYDFLSRLFLLSKMPENATLLAIVILQRLDNFYSSIMPSCSKALLKYR